MCSSSFEHQSYVMSLWDREQDTLRMESFDSISRLAISLVSATLESRISMHLWPVTMKP